MTRTEEMIILTDGYLKDNNLHPKEIDEFIDELLDLMLDDSMRSQDTEEGIESSRSH